MRMRMFPLAMTISLAAASPARADYITTGYDEYGAKYLLLSSDTVFFLLIGGVLLLLGILFEAVSSSNDSCCDLPAEIEPPTDTVEQYEQDAARLRALARKLDAETAFKESQVRARLKEDEFEEIDAVLRNAKATREK